MFAHETVQASRIRPSFISLALEWFGLLLLFFQFTGFWGRIFWYDGLTLLNAAIFVSK